MKPFQVGERVICYGQDHEGTFDAVSHEGDSGVVSEIDATGFVSVKMDVNYGRGVTFLFHHKQCRRLKPRTKLKKVVMWKSLFDSPTGMYSGRAHKTKAAALSVDGCAAVTPVTVYLKGEK